MHAYAKELTPHSFPRWDFAIRGLVLVHIVTPNSLWSCLARSFRSVGAFGKGLFNYRVGATHNNIGFYGVAASNYYYYYLQSRLAVYEQSQVNMSAKLTAIL